MAPLLLTYQQLSRRPFGRWLFSRAVCFKAPYFASIAPRFESLDAGRCVVSMPDRRRVRNHIGTVHAIALCNLAELAAGVMTDASLPRGMRWIPKGMTVEYLAKARGRMRATATPAVAMPEADSAYALPVDVEVHDVAGTVVFRACIDMWVTPATRHAARATHAPA